MRRLICLLFPLLIFTVTQLLAQENTRYPLLWKQLEEQEKNGRTKDALVLAQQILAKAGQNKHLPDYYKALLFSFKFRMNIEEDSETTIIHDIRHRISNATRPEERALLQMLLADCLQDYLNQNQYQLLDRTLTDENEEDFRLWDNRMFEKNIRLLFLEALSNAEALQQIPLGDISLIVKGNKENYQLLPTMYDLLSYEAVVFFSSAYNRMSNVKDAYELTDTLLFAPAPKFMSLTLSHSDSLSNHLITLQILQKWMKEKYQSADTPMAGRVDFQRIQYVHDNFGIEDKKRFYQNALSDAFNRYRDSSLKADTRFAILQNRLNQGNTDTDNNELSSILAEAKELQKEFPGTNGAKNAARLEHSILRKELIIQAEEAVYPGAPFKILLNYRNLKEVSYRIVELGDKEIIEYSNEPDSLWKLQQGLKLIRSGKWNIPAPHDLISHRVEAPVDALPAGRYLVLVHWNNPFQQPDSVLLASAVFYVTRLSSALIPTGDEMIIRVSDRMSGQPLAGTDVSAFYSKWDYSQRKIQPTLLANLITDKNGEARIQLAENQRSNVFLKLKSGTDRYTTGQQYLSGISGAFHEDKSQVRVHLFTDRAIYRPGQSVYFKGIITEQTGPDFKPVTAHAGTINLLDVNGVIITTLPYLTNDYGSFSGFFDLPVGRLNGQYQLQVLAKGTFQAQPFLVEEYKRPNFEVLLDTLEGSYKLGDTITMTGRAVAYSGASISHAKVTYSIKKISFLPWWMRYSYSSYFPLPSYGRESVVEFGEAITTDDGSFTIRFPALPDNYRPGTYRLNYHFEVTAEVTDINSETQSARTSVRVGPWPVDPSMSVPLQVNEGETVRIDLKSVNLQERPVASQMWIEIEALQPPSVPKKTRYWEAPDRFMLTKAQHDARFPHDIYHHEDDKGNWPVLRSFFKQSYQVKGDSAVSIGPIPAGIYKVTLKVPVSDKDTIQMNAMMEVMNAAGISPVPHFLQANTIRKSCQPGDTLKITFQSALPEAVLYIRLMHKGQLLKNETLTLKGKPYDFKWPVDSTHRGGLEVFYDLTAQNRNYSGKHFIEVPFEPLNVLQYSWKTFRDKLEPGSNERWELTIKGKKGEAVAAEVLATMYDASLDRFASHEYGYSLMRPRYYSYGNNAIYFGSFRVADANSWKGKVWRDYFDYYFPELPRLSNFGFSIMPYVYDYARPQMAMAAPVPSSSKGESLMAADEIRFEKPAGQESEPEDAASPSSNVPAAVFRKNFNETAFYFPHMKTDEAGNVVLSFTIPEALTRWKLLGMAHTTGLEHVLLREEVMTTKDLMITPNKLRFFRSGDTLFFNARISNMTGQSMEGMAELHFRDATTNQIVDEKIVLSSNQQKFTVGKNGSAAVSWKIIAPQGLQGVIYEVSANSGRFTDAESDVIPVLENRMLITESLPIYLKKKGRHSITFDRFKNQASSTLATQSLTLEYTSNPVWYALMALPYVKEQENMSSTALFNRFYANTMAAFILKQIPQSKQLLEVWKKSGDLKSALEKHQELKSVVLEATPWLRNAASETEQMQQLVKLFEEAENTFLNNELIQKLQEMQTPNGGLCWYPGMPDNRFLTQYFAAGIGQLHQMGALDLKNPRISDLLSDMISYLDNKMKEDFDEIQRRDSNWISNDHLGYMQIHYLYTRSFFNPKEYPLATGTNTAYLYFLNQGYLFGMKKEVYAKGLLALALNRDNRPKEAARLVESLRQNAVQSKKVGMYWKSLSRGGYWYEAPISTHALMIQVFSEVAKDMKSVNELKTWLILQKQTQSWGNRRATADACYALLLTGGNWKTTSSDAIRVAGKTLMPDKKMEGLGYQTRKWMQEAVKPEMATIEIKKAANYPSWGAMYWQYLEDMDKVTGAGNELQVKRRLYKVVLTDAGETLIPAAATKIQSGDKLRIKLEITASRDMEFVHLQDARGAGMEPLEVVSGYKFEGGLSYYKVTGDAATHWYVERLSKGIYTLEYSVYAASSGRYISGVAYGECLYAPEFRSHTHGERVQVHP